MSTAKPWTPAPSKVGTSGSRAERWREPTARTVALLASVQTGTKDLAASNLMRPPYGAGIIVWLVASTALASGLRSTTCS